MNAVLLVTERRDLAADLLVLALKRKGADFLRLNLDTFPEDIVATWSPSVQLGRITVGQDSYRPQDFRAAWFRRLPTRFSPYPDDEPAHGFVTRERIAFIEGLLETPNWLWVNRPTRIRMADNKLVQLQMATTLGFEVPETIVTNDPRVVRDFAATRRAIAKTISGPAVLLENSKKIIFTQALEPGADDSDSSIQVAPFIVQERIEPKSDLRVTVVGDELFATRITAAPTGASPPDWRASPPEDLRYEPTTLPEQVESRCLAMMQRCGLLYGAFDFAVDSAGRHFFLEVNPSGQWGWIEKATGYPLTDRIARLLCGGE